MADQERMQLNLLGLYSPTDWESIIQLYRKILPQALFLSPSHSTIKSDRYSSITACVSHAVF